MALPAAPQVWREPSAGRWRRRPPPRCPAAFSYGRPGGLGLARTERSCWPVVCELALATLRWKPPRRMTTSTATAGRPFRPQPWPSTAGAPVATALVVHKQTRTTTAGTPQDTDGMYWEAYKLAQGSMKFVIDQLQTLAPVDVIYCPSNHDFMSGFMLVDSLSMAYESNPNVSFNCDMTHRKYYKYGLNLICASHGDGMKMSDMPLIMAEESKMWDSTKFRYCYLHHYHS